MVTHLVTTICVLLFMPDLRDSFKIEDTDAQNGILHTTTTGEYDDDSTAYDDEYYLGDDEEEEDYYDDYDGVPNPNIEEQFPVGDFEINDIDMPEELILNINIYLDQTWKELHKENRYAKAKQIIRQASSLFKHPSLNTKFELQHNDRIFDVERSFQANELFHNDKKKGHDQ